VADRNVAGAHPAPPLVAVVRRVLPAPPEAVYDEWVDPDALSDWMCPRPARCLEVNLQPWVGGALRIDIEESGVTFFVAGRFKVLDRPRRVGFTWHCSTWSDGTPESLVTVSFSPHGDGQTLMTIEHTRLPTELVEQHRRGWGTIAGQLDTVLGARRRHL
jgi:uncharacterized protein YndB with AHSA1/START domain